MFATKNLKALCDVALQPLWRYVKDRHHSYDDTWSSGTNLKKYSFLFSLVAKLHVSSQLLWRVVTFCADRQVFQVCVHCLLFPAFSQRMYDMNG